jgi:hypothetical protein
LKFFFQVFIRNLKVFLFHKAKVDYTNLSLTAEYIEIDLSKSIAFAKGIPDSTGKLKGKPILTQGADKYEANSMTYNFKTKRAKIEDSLNLLPGSSSSSSSSASTSSASGGLQGGASEDTSSATSEN